jgi:hypothetical protein
VLSDRAPNREWARTMWRWGVETGADMFVTLQDDVELAPRFLDILRAMLPAVPSRAILGLAGHHPGLNGQPGPWARSGGWVVGWAYGMSRETLRELVDFDASGIDADHTEDMFVNSFAARYGHETWHPLPSVVDHRTEIESTYGNDGRHPYRRSHVRWDGCDLNVLASPEYWRPKGEPPWIEYGPNWGGIAVAGISLPRIGPAFECRNGIMGTHNGSGPPVAGTPYEYQSSIIKRVGGY